MTKAISRRGLLQGASVAVAASPSLARARQTRLAETPRGARVTLERRGAVVMIGLNRPAMRNMIDPETWRALARAYTQFEHDQTLRVAVLFGQGADFSGGLDAGAFRAEMVSGKPLLGEGLIDPLGNAAKLTKPLIAVTHGQTSNAAHDLHLAADIRVTSVNVRFSRDGGVDAVGDCAARFAAACGRANALRYLLSPDPWGAAEAWRMGEVQEIAPDPQAALEAGLRIAQSAARCAPQSVQAMLSATRASASV